MTKEYVSLTNNIRDLEKKFKADNKTIKKKLLKLGFLPSGKSNNHVRSKVKDHVKNSGYSVPIPENSLAMELIIGGLLGDGCMYTTDKVKDRAYKFPNTVSEYK